MAAETRDVSNATEFIVLNESDIAIKTYYLKEEKPFILLAQIEDIPEVAGGINFIEGELRIDMIHNPDRVDVKIESSTLTRSFGNLLITTDDDDANNYSIDSDGFLIYTYP